MVEAVPSAGTRPVASCSLNARIRVVAALLLCVAVTCLFGSSCQASILPSVELGTLPSSNVGRELLAKPLGPETTGKYAFLVTAPISPVHTYQIPNSNKFLFTDFWYAGVKYPGPPVPANPKQQNILQVWDRSTNQFRVVPNQVNRACGGWVGVPNGDVVLFGSHISVPNVVVRRQLDAVALFSTTTNVLSKTNLKLAYPRWYSSGVLLSTGQPYTFGGSQCAGCQTPFTGYSPSADIIDTDNDRTMEVPIPNELLRTGEDNFYVLMTVLPTGKLSVMDSNTIKVIDPFTGLIVARAPALPAAANGLRWEYPFTGAQVSLIMPVLKLGEGAKFEYVAFGGQFTNKVNRKALAATQALCAKISVRITLTMTPAGAFSFGPWQVENMPDSRCVFTGVTLPTGQVFLSAGSRRGMAGFGPLTKGSYSNDPDTEPWIYTPNAGNGKRFKKTGTRSRIARLYHGTSLLTDQGDILISGSTCNVQFTSPNLANFDVIKNGGSEFRIESYSPYHLFLQRPTISVSSNKLAYADYFTVTSDVPLTSIVLLAPGTSTHGVVMGSRAQQLEFSDDGSGDYGVAVPESAHLAPPGWYLLFGVTGTSYSKGAWVQLDPDTSLVPSYSWSWFSPTKEPIVSQMNSMCLSVGDSKAAGDSIYAVTCDGSTSQSWTMDDNTLTLKNTFSGLCMEGGVVGGSVVQKGCNNNNLKQKWLPSSGSSLGQISPAHAAALCLIVKHDFEWGEAQLEFCHNADTFTNSQFVDTIT